MAAINSAADLAIEDGVALVTIDSPPVNALSQAVREGLKRGVETAEANGAVKAIVIICGGRTFIAGADISEFGKPPAPPNLPGVLDRIENASKPVVARSMKVRSWSPSWMTTRAIALASAMSVPTLSPSHTSPHIADDVRRGSTTCSVAPFWMPLSRW